MSGGVPGATELPPPARATLRAVSPPRAQPRAPANGSPACHLSESSWAKDPCHPKTVSLRSQDPGRGVAVCGARARLPLHLTPSALSSADPGSATIADVEVDLHCSLEAHSTGDHHAFVMHIDGPDTGSVWTSWPDGRLPTQVEVRGDCEAVSPPERGREACCEFAGHPGAHSFDVDDSRAPEAE
jgi:hypothetical protein